MKFVVHAGMHKTGSTSIQQAFYQKAGKDYAYIDVGNPNFSIPMFLMFEDEAHFQSNIIVKAMGRSQEELIEERATLHAQVDAQIMNCPSGLMMFSGEDISGYNVRIVERFAAYLRKYSDDLHVFTYVRPPCGYMESAFQERLKRSYVDMSPEKLWPRYMPRFKNMIAGFGRENLTFVPFEKACLASGDVVTDFAFRTGLPCPIGPQRSYNESLTAEAVSLLYHFRKHISPEPQNSQDGFKTELRFIKQIGTIGTTKLRFGKEFLQKGRHKFRDDWEFAKELCGSPLRERRDSGDGFITTEADLETLALATLPDLKDLIWKKGGTGRGSLTDCLKELLALAEGGYSLPPNSKVTVMLRHAAHKMRRSGLGSVIDRLQERA